MPSTSSLLRSSASTRKKVLSQQDAEAEYEYSLGYKTYEDYREYDRYLDKRASSSTDPGQALTLQKRRNTAFRGYMGNEIQRQTIGVLEGRQSNTDKYNAMYSLYQNAVSQGLYDQAQTLYLQLGNLDRTIQNEAVAAAGSASSAMKAQVTAVKDEVSAHKAALADLGASMQELGGIDELNKRLEDPETIKQLVSAYPDLAEVYKNGGKIGLFDIAAGITENIKDTYAAAIGALPPEEASKLQGELDKLTSGKTTFDIPGFADKVSMTDLQNQITQAREGRSYFFRGQDGELQKGSVTDYTWDREGKVIPVYADPLSAGTKDNPYLQTVDNFKESGAFRRDDQGRYIDETGKVVAEYRDGRLTAPGGGEFANEADYNKALSSARVGSDTLLREQGFNVVTEGENGLKKGKNGGVLVTVTEETIDKLGNLPGLKAGNAVEMFVDGQGNLRYSPGNSGKLYQGAIDERGQVNFRELAPGEQGAISSQGRQDLGVDMSILADDLKSKGVSQVTGSSLAASNQRIALGEGFTKGVLKDAETRRRFLAGQEIENARGEKVTNDPRVNPALRLNAAERTLNKAIKVADTITNPYKPLKNVLSSLKRRANPPIVMGAKSFDVGNILKGLK